METFLPSEIARLVLGEFDTSVYTFLQRVFLKSGNRLAYVALTKRSSSFNALFAFSLTRGYFE